MFDSIGSLAVSGLGYRARLSLETFEDRTTPAAVGAPADRVGTFDFNAAVLDGVTLPLTAATDSAFLGEVARISVMQWFLGTTEANQGADPVVREFGQELAQGQLALFNQLLPVITRSGIPIPLARADLQLAVTLSGATGAVLDTQVLVWSSVYTMQAAGLAQVEIFLGTEVVVRTFAHSELEPLQNQLQTGLDILGPDSTGAIVVMFSRLGGFGSIRVSPFGTIGFGTTGLAQAPPPATLPDLFGDPLTVGYTPVSLG